MIRGRGGSWVGLSTRLKLYGIRRLCTKGENGAGNKLEKTRESRVAHQNETETSVVSRYDETYKKLDKLDFVTAAKILFTEPPETNKFGFDWHVVQFIIVCLPSVAVYLVAQYARRKMKIMDAELGEKKRKEEEKKEKEEAEQKALAKEAATKSHDELMEMKERLGKIEETIKDIVLEAKKPSGNAPTKTQEDQPTKLSPKEESKPEKRTQG
ncbi:PREDICTED: protein MNN4 [Camelina sativa]|uniref:Protein MNN4 n=1 Tax=Camelina sativa TaxID=90675 RepID=A0ABM0SXS8_CAMSA|nr:PREDICTED: protein MNN4 [Camelina sativa]